MKKILLAFIVLAIWLNGNAQSEKKIEIASLVNITEASDFTGLVKLVKSLSYHVVDSSKQADGGFSYITLEKKPAGNTLACHLDAKNKIKEIIFLTYSKEMYDDLKQQAKKAGFESSGLHNKNRPEGIIESEDFSKGKMLVSSAAKKGENGAVQYEFDFMNW